MINKKRVALGSAVVLAATGLLLGGCKKNQTMAGFRLKWFTTNPRQ